MENILLENVVIKRRIQHQECLRRRAYLQVSIECAEKVVHIFEKYAKENFKGEELQRICRLAIESVKCWKKYPEWYRTVKKVAKVLENIIIIHRCDIIDNTAAKYAARAAMCLTHMVNDH